MKTYLYRVLSYTHLSFTPHHNWSLIYMTLNVEDVNEKVFNVLKNLMKVSKKIVAGTLRTNL